MDAKAETVERLTERLDEAAKLRVSARTDVVTSRKRALLRRWQSDRLARTHADLLENPRFAAAARFFLDEIYGVKDNAQRDADVARVVPAMAKFLPVAGIETVADAVDLDALSEDLDAALGQALGKRIVSIDPAVYGAAYRAVGRRDDRLRQLGLIAHLGHALDRMTRGAFAGAALKLMRKPAAVAGFSELHAFLQSGYDAFRKMGAADEFLERILAREHAVLEALFSGDDRVLEKRVV